MTQHTETVTVKFREEEVRKMIWALEFMTKVSSMCQKDFEVNELLIDMNRILEQIKEAKGEKENNSYIQEASCESCEG